MTRVHSCFGGGGRQGEVVTSDCKGAGALTPAQNHNLSLCLIKGEISAGGLKEKVVDWSEALQSSSVSYTLF